MNDMNQRHRKVQAKVRKPQWWQLYVMIPMLLALFLPEMRLPLTSTEHILAQLGILFLIYGFVQVWLRANRRALMGLDEQQGEWQVRVYTIPPARMPAKSEAPLFRLPAAGLKGVLDNTFEMEVPEEKESVFSGENAVARKV